MQHDRRAAHRPFHRLGLAALVVAAACGPFRRNAYDPNAQVVVSFVNQSTDQANVYAVTSSGERIRLGTVMSGQTTSLVLPRTVTALGSAYLTADLLARSATPRTGLLTFVPGDRLTVTLPAPANTLVVTPGRS